MEELSNYIQDEHNAYIWKEKADYLELKNSSMDFHGNDQDKLWIAQLYSFKTMVTFEIVMNNAVIKHYYTCRL